MRDRHLFGIHKNWSSGTKCTYYDNDDSGDNDHEIIPDTSWSTYTFEFNICGSVHHALYW